MDENFKKELLSLLQKYNVNEVHVKLNYEISIGEQNKVDVVGGLHGGVQEETPKGRVTEGYVSPQKAALTAAEQTIASLSKSAGIKITQS